MKQLGLGVLQYAQDNDDRYPCGFEVVPGVHVDSWASSIYPYVKNKADYHCPDDPTASMGYLVPISYAINWNLMHDPRSDGSMITKTLTDPSSTILMCEVQGILSDPSYPIKAHDRSVAVTMGSAFWDGNLPFWTGQYATGSAPGEPIPVANNKARHNPASVYLLADGHVRLLRPDKISPGYAASSSNSTETDSGTSNNASGTGCLDNLPADWGTKGCPHPGTAMVTFSPR